MPFRSAVLVLALLAGTVRGDTKATSRPVDPKRVEDLLVGNFKWTYSAPLVAPARRDDDPCYSVKDPSVVYHHGRWHLFCTIRSKVRSHQIEYSSFADWKDADVAERHILAISPGYFCAPQVFYFEPQRRWYMILQVNDPARTPALQPAFSTSDDLSAPGSWSKPTLLFDAHPANVKHWIDFWVICDEQKAHLFFTGDDGLMWRSETTLADFPRGWDEPRIVIKGDLFEASCTYKLKGLDKYLTIVEAIDTDAGGRRFYKAWLADRLDGEWRPIAATTERAFANLRNVKPAEDVTRWTDSISHGEMLRSGFDQRLEIDPAHLRFLFQGVSDADRKGKPYGQIPWRLGILESDGQGQ